jgi:curli biogenesis system outer membrane secretion channel CsgG
LTLDIFLLKQRDSSALVAARLRERLARNGASPKEEMAILNGFGLEELTLSAIMDRAARLGTPGLPLSKGEERIAVDKTAYPEISDKASSQQITVAVVGFDNRSTKDLPNLGNVAQDITTSYLYTLPGVVLVTRDRLDSVRKEIKLPDTVHTSTGITNVGHLLQADALVTGSIVRYDVERRTFEGFGTSALQDVFRMALSLQVLDVESGCVQFSKNFEVEHTKQYPKGSSAPNQPIDLTGELLTALLEQAQPDLRSALTQVLGGLGKAGQFIDVPVSSTPAGADIILNGIYMGKTPKTLQLALEIHEIEVVLEGYQPWIRRFRAEPGKGIEATLVPKVH